MSDDTELLEKMPKKKATNGDAPSEDKLLVRYRQMYVREIDLRRRRTRALVCSVPQE